MGDFAPYKPLYFAEGRLDEVTLFHPSVLERCYLPPEKINNERAAASYKYANIVKEEETLDNLKAMDVYSVGCILLELFVGDANPLFTYQRMISYRSGDKSALDRLNSVQDKNVRDMIAKMVSIDPKERGSFKDHLPVFSNLMPKEILELYAFFNYALRRAEFSQPDNKLALIRMIAPLFIEATTKHVLGNDKLTIGDRFDGIVFHRCFPYHLSKVAILYQFKGIISSNPLGSFFSNENLISYIDKTIAQTEKSDYKIASANPSSTIYLDGVQYLQESTLDINQKPYKDIDPYLDKADMNNMSVTDLFTEQLTKAKRSSDQHKVLEKFTVMSSMIETICSLLRNLQLSQSYLLALELLENLSRFVRSEEIILHIFPHLQSQVELQSNKIEKYYSIDLFCKLAKRIRYIPKYLAKSAAYSGYIRTMIDLCKGDPFLQNQIFKNIRSFIYLNILFSVLAIQSKIEEKKGKTDPDFVMETVGIGFTHRLMCRESLKRSLVILN